MRWVRKAGVKLFRLSFWTDRSSRKSQVFRLDPPVGKLGPFSTDKSDCVRNGLSKQKRSSAEDDATQSASGAPSKRGSDCNF